MIGRMETLSGLIDLIRAFFRRSALLFKVLGVLVLALLLQIPVAFIDGLLRERTHRRDTAVREITDTWGRAQQIAGPVLVVPYRTRVSEIRERLVNGRLVQTTEERLVEKNAVFLPESLAVTGDIAPAIRRRGIYEAVVYTTRLQLSGRFDPPDLKSLNLAAADLLWDRAWIAFGLSDLRGAQSALALDWNGAAIPFEPGSRDPLLPSGLHAPLPPLAAGVAPGEFTLDFVLNGSGQLDFIPLARQTDVKLASDWADPGFNGAFLPAARDIGPDGFSATWSVPYYAHEYGRHWSAEIGRPSANALGRSAFGVELVRPVDAYRTVERSSKYALLFIALIFTAFFLFEVLAALRLSALHYLLVGAALVLFYLALLALSEVVAFDLAYLAAALASSLLVTGYSASILHGGRRSLIIAAALALIYGTLWVILQLQDYSLLAGTAVLFAVLATVMFTTRNLDWNRHSS